MRICLNPPFSGAGMEMEAASGKIKVRLVYFWT